MTKRRLWFGSCVLAGALVGPACREVSQTPAELPTVSPLSEGPTASPQPPLPPEAARPASKLSLEVITGSKEGFFANSTLVTGKKEAILIDAQFTLADGAKVAAAAVASGKTLTTVYVTHFHPDHYFGFLAIKEKFPNAKLVALPQTVSMIEKSWAAKVKQWEPLYKDAIPSNPIVPEPLAGGSLELEGQKLELVGGQQGDSADNSYVWIPSLHAVVTGDIAYDGVFPWTAETTAAERTTWRATLDKLASLNAEVVVPGHQNVGRRGPNPASAEQASSIQFTKEYLTAYDEMLASAKSAADLEARIKARYPDTALDAIVRIAAEAAFPAKIPKKKALSGKAKP
jgi:glyoxylase-like metal-dependent hydrolase (beta-lactamase superfamily II)